ncbi:OsmC family protein [Fusobacterium perfoetens]|uniref:OsmC family protein n=1 Tax=Fusobacterium perfoetens TaxID=852 RepID=UPI000480190A|nr:OsmC family protein [Fusobacterium perfoetens]MCI6153285.1 OsmC family protein [Fusobacterium perfoetens]MDY3238386.1 OsmC family protein [Fusobacterium perfoetens]
MAIKTYKAFAEKIEGLKVKATARDFSIILDEPENQGGNNEGMNPVELALCSLSACQTITAIIFADFYGIPLEDIKIEAVGEMDSDGFSNPNVRTGFQKISFKFHIKSSASKFQIEELVKIVEKMCPVGDSLKNNVILEKPEIILE